MTDCERLRPVLVRMVEGDAGPEEALEFGMHVSDCTLCRIVLARQRRIADMVSELGEPIDVDESFLQQVMAALPDGPPPPRPHDVRRRGSWRLVKLASFLLLALLFFPGTGGLSGTLDGAAELPRLVAPSHPDAFDAMLPGTGGLPGLLFAAVIGASSRMEVGAPVLAFASGLVTAIVAAAATALLALSAGVGMAARAVARSVN